MNNINPQKLFSQPFLSGFIFSKEILPFSEKEIFELDKDLLNYERLFLNPDIEKNLISKNEFFASFAISKAENSTLTIKEANEIDLMIENDEKLNFISSKLKSGNKFNQKDYEKLEFFNIAKIFKKFNQAPFSFTDLSPNLIKKLHYDLTKGLDIFKNHIINFDVYKSGKFRDNNKIRVGNYTPAPYKEIENGVKELILWLKNNKSIASIAIFHTALYAIHPFNNGNKRVCRILEHILLREAGLNPLNIYSPSYYYHQEKERYYKYLLYSLEHKNLNHFTVFSFEAIVLSIIEVLKSGIEVKRAEFIKNADLSIDIKNILKPLAKRKEIQFKNLFKIVHNKLARQTFVNYLEKAADKAVIKKRKDGRAVYYSLNLVLPEEKFFYDKLEFIKTKLSYIPDDIKLF
ncbi:MAG: Fic family protein [bacterium]